MILLEILHGRNRKSVRGGFEKFGTVDNLREQAECVLGCEIWDRYI